MEFVRSGQLHIDELTSSTLYEIRFNEQVKKLQELGVDVSVDSAAATSVTAATSGGDEAAKDDEDFAPLEHVDTRKYAAAGGEKATK